MDQFCISLSRATHDGLFYITDVSRTVERVALESRSRVASLTSRECVVLIHARASSTEPLVLVVRRVMVIVVVMIVMMRLIDHHLFPIVNASEEIVEHNRDRQLRHHDAL